MPEREPIDVKNLDIYGEAPLEWSRIHDQLTAGEGENPEEWHHYFLGTVGRDGRPHSAGVGAMWYDGAFYLAIGPKTRKGQNLAQNPKATIAVALDGIDAVFEGEVERVTDAETLTTLVTKYNETGWPVTVEGDAFTGPFSAPSAGKPPWNLYRFTVKTVFGVAGREPNGATRWRFGS